MTLVKIFIALIAIFAVSISAPCLGYEEEPSLEINLVVDPLIRERFSDDSAFGAYLEDLISRASIIFNSEIGKHLRIGTVMVSAPPRNGRAADLVEEPEVLMAWLKKQDRGSGRFLAFLTNSPFYDRGHNRFLGGYSDPRGNRLFLVEYAFETQRMAMVILHEIGHLCGAGHSENGPSIMSRMKNNSLSFEEHALIIRRNC